MTDDRGVRVDKARAPRSVSNWLWLALLAAALFAGFAAWKSGMLVSSASDLPPAFPSPHQTWQDHLGAIDATIREHHARASREPTDWLSASAEAGAWLDRASMSGRWQDYRAAEAALALAMQRADNEALKPYPLAARIAAGLHRDTDVGPALDAAVADRQFALPEAQANAMILRGDVLLYQGRWRDADAWYARSQSVLDDGAARMRRAVILQRTGTVADARQAWLDAAVQTNRPSRRLLSHVAMRLGNLALDTGDWAQAEQWYGRASNYLPGDWRVEALRIQMRMLNGERAAALRDMAQLAQAQDLPELWDALGAWRKSAGDSAGADAAFARAKAGWDAWAAHYPQAAAAHMAEHALATGDTANALLWARRHYNNRPYGDAAVLYAAALAASGDIDQALALVRRVRSDGWRSTELDRMAFELNLLRGDAAAAEDVRAAAQARNPRSFDPAAPLIRFGLH